MCRWTGNLNFQLWLTKSNLGECSADRALLVISEECLVCNLATELAF